MPLHRHAAGELFLISPLVTGWLARRLTYGRYLPITYDMRRKPGTLIPIERSILEAATDFARRGEPEFHGYAVAGEIREREGARRLTGHGTLYKALDRLERAGLLASRWEDPDVAASEGRPRRRLYRLTAEGERALAAAREREAAPVARLRPGRSAT
jgi:DNA-binding PadR family transcriptional regulator